MRLNALGHDSTTYATFNKSAARDAGKRLLHAGAAIDCRTLHALAFHLVDVRGSAAYMQGDGEEPSQLLDDDALGKYCLDNFRQDIDAFLGGVRDATKITLSEKKYVALAIRKTLARFAQSAAGRRPLTRSIIRSAQYDTLTRAFKRGVCTVGHQYRGSGRQKERRLTA